MKNGRKKTKIISILIVVSMLLSFAFACSGRDNGKTDDKGGSECTIYTAPSTVKYLQDDDLSASTEIMPSPEIVMCSGESESVQLIISAKEDIREYTVGIGNLVSESGSEIPSENIDVFVLKYHNVTINSKYSSVKETGSYGSV